jgi:hypothetical protein
MEKRMIRLSRGAKCGLQNEPLYGWQEVQAYCEGGLAVHKALPGVRWKWMVTHESSGLSMEVIGAMTKARATDNVRAALALPFDWTRDEAATLQALRESRGIVDALRKIGESN